MTRYISADDDGAVRLLPSLTTRDLLLLAVALLIALPGAVRLFELATGARFQFDFAIHYHAAQRLLNGERDIYTIWPGDIRAEYPAPPDFLFAAPVLPHIILMFHMPFAALPYPLAQAAWTLSNLALTLFSLWWVARAVRLPLPLAGWVAVALVVVLFPPWQRTMTLGQTTCLLWAALAAAFYYARRQKDAPVGIAIGIATLIKVFPAAFIAYYIWRRRWRTVAWSLVTIAGALAVSVAVLGLETHVYWLQYTLGTLSVNYYETPPNQSLPFFFNLLFARTDYDPHWIIAPETRQAMAGLASLAVLGVTAFAFTSKPPLRGFELNFEYTLVLCATLMLFSRMWDYYYTPLLTCMLALYLGDHVPLQYRRDVRTVVALAYMLMVVERYWPLFPKVSFLMFFGLYGNLLLWGASLYYLVRLRRADAHA